MKGKILSNEITEASIKKLTAEIKNGTKDIRILALGTMKRGELKYV